MAIDYDNPAAPFAWWESKRLRYNVGLVVAGILAFLCYCIVFTILYDEIVAVAEEPTGVEITLFTTFVQGIGYLLMMGVANICYLLGPLLETLTWIDRGKYRRWAYNLGCWGSLALPFAIPVLVAVAYI